MNDNKWAEYYDITKENSPRKTLIKAIEFFSAENINFPKTAIDLGCGSGADTLFLLQNDWSVLAIDSQPTAISTLLSIARQLNLDEKLKTSISSFESLTALPSVNLLNASFSLPFLKSDSFYQFWNIILNSLHHESRFAGSFFGIHDDWNTRPNMTLLKREMLFDLFDQFKIEFFEEEENDGSDALGYTKHWHKFLVVAKKTS